jgi:hypothetical protein
MSKATKKPAAKPTKAASKQTSSTEPARSESGVRQLQRPRRIWYKPLTWRNRRPVPAYKPLPKARVLFVASLKPLWQHKGLFSGIVGIYGVLSLILVRGLSGSSDLTSVKVLLDSTLNGVSGKLLSSLASFGYLITTSGSADVQDSGVYQSFLFLICSLAFVWALRQVLAGRKIGVRDSFYHGMYPLVPFLLVFAIIGVQFLPAVIGGALYNLMIGNGIAVHVWEKTLCVVVFIGLALWSLKMIVGTIFALYISMLPDMTPVRAVRSSQNLVYGRRLLLWRKLIFLPVILVLLAVVFELPIILFLTPIAPWTFFIMTMLALPVAHSYLYNLYREML